MAAPGTFADYALGTATPQMFGTVTPNTDCLPLINQAVAYLKSIGGGTLRLPYIGGYVITDAVNITFSNCHVVLEDDVRLTKTTKASAFHFYGASGTAITNVSIRGNGARRMIDGNGRNMTGYTYSTSDTYYSCVLFRYCDNWRCEDIYGYNGLVNCIRAAFCGFGIDQDCDASDSAYDNGHSIDFDRTGYTWSDTDAQTWSNAIILNARAWNCAGLGITSYSSTNVTVLNPHVWNCGNDVAGLPTNGGGISFELDPSNPTRNHRGSLIGGSVDSCYNQGLVVTAIGLSVDGIRVANTIKPVNRSNPTGYFGSNVALLGAATARLTNVVLTKAGVSHVFALASGGKWPTVYVDGVLDTAVGNGVYGRGIARLEVGPGTRIVGSSGGTGSFANAVNVDNTGGTDYNTGAGSVVLSGSFERSASLGVDINGVGTVNASDVQLIDNRLVVASSGAMFRVQNTSSAIVVGVTNYDANNYTTNIVQFLSTVSTGGAIAVVGASTSAPVNNAASAKLVVDSGWTAGTGTPSKSAIATFTKSYTTPYVAPSISNPPTQAEVQGIANALASASSALVATQSAVDAESKRRLALEQAIRSAGLIN